MQCNSVFESQLLRICCLYCFNAIQYIGVTAEMYRWERKKFNFWLDLMLGVIRNLHFLLYLVSIYYDFLIRFIGKTIDIMHFLEENRSA